MNQHPLRTLSGPKGGRRPQRSTRHLRDNRGTALRGHQTFRGPAGCTMVPCGGVKVDVGGTPPQDQDRSME